MKNNINMEKRTVEISLETAKEWYNSKDDVLKELAIQAFTKNELQPTNCVRVRSWEEFCEKNNKIEKEYYIASDSDLMYFDLRDDIIIKRHIDKDKNILATKEDAEAFLALIQLKRLRDQWWEALNWKPDYKNPIAIKYTIVQVENEIVVDAICVTNTFLAFPTKEIAEEFLLFFKELIEKAKDLI